MKELYENPFEVVDERRQEIFPEDDLEFLKNFAGGRWFRIFETGSMKDISNSEYRQTNLKNVRKSAENYYEMFKDDDNKKDIADGFKRIIDIIDRCCASNACTLEDKPQTLLEAISPKK